MQHTLTFTRPDNTTPIVVKVPTNTLLADAAQMAGLDIGQPCGGQGRCGRCAVQVTQGIVRRRSALRLSPESIEQGYALACQTVVEGDVAITIPPQEKIERKLTTDRVAAEVTVPVGYEYLQDQTVRRIHLRLNPPTMEDQTDDWARLQTALRLQANVGKVNVSLALIQSIGDVLRAGEWNVTAVLEYPLEDTDQPLRLISLQPGFVDEYSPLWGMAVDIGTTTVSVWLVDLVTGQVKAQVAEYNGQIARGEDVISRIMYAGKGNGREEMRQRVLDTINKLIETACKRVNAKPEEVVKATIAGNSNDNGDDNDDNDDNHNSNDKD